MPSERFANILASATFGEFGRSTSPTGKNPTVQYTRLDEAAKFLDNSEDETEKELQNQLKRDGWRLK